jgi:hypothetical protein
MTPRSRTGLGEDSLDRKQDEHIEIDYLPAPYSTTTTSPAGYYHSLHANEGKRFPQFLSFNVV